MTDNEKSKIRDLSTHALTVLRRVRAGDPYRGRARGARGWTARHKTLGYLRDRGYVRVDASGLWGVTKAGKAYLVAHPVR
jgi:hypothetical protein